VPIGEAEDMAAALEQAHRTNRFSLRDWPPATSGWRATMRQRHHILLDLVGKYVRRSTPTLARAAGRWKSRR
jgi:hypothetical protein